MLKGILAINDILNDYSKEIQESITEKAIEVAKNGVNTLKQTSPKAKKNTSQRGRYARGWRVKTTKGKGFVNCIIHNATDYQLTHLLEREHATANGGKYVPKKPHIQPVNDMCVSDFKNGVEEIIRNGG